MFSAGSRPWDKEGGAVIQTLRQGGGGGGLQKFFQPFQLQFCLKIRGSPGPLGPSNGSPTDVS